MKKKIQGITVRFIDDCQNVKCIKTKLAKRRIQK